MDVIFEEMPAFRVKLAAAKTIVEKVYKPQLASLTGAAPDESIVEESKEIFTSSFSSRKVSVTSNGSEFNRPKTGTSYFNEKIKQSLSMATSSVGTYPNIKPLQFGLEDFKLQIL